MSCSSTVNSLSNSNISTRATIVTTNYTITKKMEKKPCIAMVPCPGLSHLIPLIEFAKLLVLHHNKFHITLLIPTLGSPTPSTKTLLNTLPPNIDFIILPQVNIEDLPPNIHLATQMKLTVKHSLPSLHQAVTSLISSPHKNLLALVFDLFSSDVLDIAKQLNILSYFFAASSAISLQFCRFLPKLDESISTEFIDTTKTFDIPGCNNVSFKVKDFPDPVLFGRSSQTYKSFLLVCQRLSLVDGIIINTFNDLESDAIKALESTKEEENLNIVVYPIGPIIQTKSKDSELCVTWLNNKPPKSVLFISFGSGGTLSHEQLNEIAFGLELSGQNFMWVIRVPNKHSSSAYFTKQKQNGDFDDDPLQYLPFGFLERTKEKGLVVPSWAPQVEILGHGSTCGFLTHCGWSSTLEGLFHGVPMIAWPLFAEQRMNAATLTDVFKVAVRPNVDEQNGIVKREEVARVVKIVMELESELGLQLRRRIEELSVAAEASLGEHGSSRKALSNLVHKLSERII